jgi:HK97 family phage major capsid protein
VYTRESARQGHTFLADGLRAAMGDHEAQARIARHTAILADQVEKRTTVVSGGVPGLIPDEVLPGLLVDRIAKSRVMGSFFTRIPVTDARPRIFAKVTTSTSVQKQSAEGVNPPDSDIATSPVSVQPEFYGGSVVVARQVLDGGDPDAERLILDDLAEAYAQTSEAAIVAAIEAGAQAFSPALTISMASPITNIQAGIIRYRTARRLRADGVFLPDPIYEATLAQADADKRPILPWVGAVNAAGTQQAGGDGASLLGVPLLQSWASAPGTAGVGGIAIFARREDAFYLESGLAEYRYEQATGPAAIRIGLWTYLKAAVRRPAGVLKAAGVA